MLKSPQNFLLSNHRPAIVMTAFIVCSVMLLGGCGPQKMMVIEPGDTIPETCYKVLEATATIENDAMGDPMGVVTGVVEARVDLPMCLVVKVSFGDRYGELVKIGHNGSASKSRSRPRPLKKGEQWEFYVSVGLSVEQAKRVHRYDIVSLFSYNTAGGFGVKGTHTIEVP
jgi:hypothetical protein